MWMIFLDERLDAAEEHKTLTRSSAQHREYGTYAFLVSPHSLTAASPVLTSVLLLYSVPKCGPDSERKVCSLGK